MEIAVRGALISLSDHLFVLSPLPAVRKLLAVDVFCAGRYVECGLCGSADHATILCHRVFPVSLCISSPVRWNRAPRHGTSKPGRMINRSRLNLAASTLMPTKLQIRMEKGRSSRATLSQHKVFQETLTPALRQRNHLEKGERALFNTMTVLLLQ